MRQRLLAFSLVALGAVVGGSALGLYTSRSRPPAAFSVVDTTEWASTAPSTSGPKSPAGTARRSTTPVRPQVARPAFEPTALDLAAPAVRAPVTPILALRGQLQPPADPKQVGWWQGGALAGASTGTTVLVGHVDSAESGLGAFYRLDQVKPGASITVADGRRTASYRVTSLQYVPKTQGLPATLFASSGPARLVLITCGGSFDSAERSYRDNVVVTAAIVDN